MKTKQYLIRYALSSKGLVINKNGFIGDLVIEFLTYIETGNGLASTRAFENKINMIRQKYESIKNASDGLDEKLWFVFFKDIIKKSQQILLVNKSDADINFQNFKTTLLLSKEKLTHEQFDLILNDKFIYLFGALNKVILPYLINQPMPLGRFIDKSEINLLAVANCIDVHQKKCFDEKTGKRKIGMSDYNQLTENKNQTLSWILTKK